MKDKTAQLAKRATKGDAAAFGELYSLFAGEMYRYALYSLGSAEAAQDAVQETALEAFKNIVRLKNEDAAKAWFFGVLYNICKRFQREKYRAEFTTLELCEELSSADSNENVLIGLDLVRLINALSEQEREIVLLSAVCGYSGKEIADVTGIPHGTVRSKLSRALAKLREETEGRK
jgi:RNA polymerase sigma-70 factor (ECF subfamily)